MTSFKYFATGLLLLALLACSAEPENNDEAVDLEGTASLEKSLLIATQQISKNADDGNNKKSVTELEQLSEADRATLRAIAEIELTESAEMEAEQQSQKESDYRVQ